MKKYIKLLFLFSFFISNSKEIKFKNDSLKITEIEVQTSKLTNELNLLKETIKSVKDSIFNQNKNFVQIDYFDLKIDSLDKINNEKLKVIDSIISLINSNSKSILLERNNIKILERDIMDVSDNLIKFNKFIEETSVRTEFNNNQISQISENFDNSKSYAKTLVIIIFTIIFIILFIVFLKNKKQNNKLNLIFENQLADSQKIVDWLSINIDKKLNTQNIEADLDHSFAKKLASEINRISYNLSLMDDSVRGYRQLSSSVKRLKITLNNNDYEMVELLGKKYDPGMNLSADFVTNSNLEKGESIITKIIKPQINFKGKMIQSAEVEVSINE